MPKKRLNLQFRPSYISRPLPAAETVEQVLIQKAQYKEMFAKVNAEQCPVCFGQLDGEVYFSHANVYCCANGEEEYKVFYRYGVEYPVYTRTTIYLGCYGYEVDSEWMTDDDFNNVICRFNLNLNFRESDDIKEKLLDFIGERFVFDADSDEKSLMNKINLYRTLS